MRSIIYSHCLEDTEHHCYPEDTERNRYLEDTEHNRYPEDTEHNRYPENTENNYYPEYWCSGRWQLFYTNSDWFTCVDERPWSLKLTVDWHLTENSVGQGPSRFPYSTLFGDRICIFLFSHYMVTSVSTFGNDLHFPVYKYMSLVLLIYKYLNLKGNYMYLFGAQWSFIAIYISIFEVHDIYRDDRHHRNIA